MIRSAYLLIFCCASLLSAFSQDASKPLAEQDVKSLLCHKWNLSYLEGMGKKISVPGKSPQLLLEFVKDGTLNEKAGKKNYTGKWSYNHDTHIITTNDQDGKEEYTIVNISEAELVIRNKFKRVIVNLGMQRVN
jgi:hypothetical protein